MPDFIVQRFHPLIRPGLYLGTIGSQIPVHSQQSAIDFLCALHCLIVVLRISGHISDPARIVTGRRRIESMIVQKAAAVFQKGMTFTELADFISGLDCGLRTTLLEHGPHRNVIPWIERELARGRLVVGRVRAVGDKLNHAVLVIGSEGVVRARQSEAHALLILDPAEGAPAVFASCNARLRYRHDKSGEVPRYGTYQTAADTFSAVINGAVSIDVSERKKPP